MSAGLISSEASLLVLQMVTFLYSHLVILQSNVSLYPNLFLEGYLEPTLMTSINLNYMFKDPILKNCNWKILFVSLS